MKANIIIVIKANSEYNDKTKKDEQKIAHPLNKVEVTGFEPVSKHIRQKLSTCLFCFEVFREATGNKQPTTSLAAWS